MNIPTSSLDETSPADETSPEYEASLDEATSGASAPTREASPSTEVALSGYQPAPLARPSEPTCAICGDAGFIVADLPVDHPDFGKAIPCKCRQQEQIERRMHRLHSISNLTSLQRLTFESFIPELSHLSAERANNLRRAFETCTYFAQEPDGWLLLTGSYGCGKTHLAAAIANARLSMGEPALFMVVPDLLDHLRATFSPQSDISYDNLFEQMRTTPLLILDDLGTQSGTPWAQEKLFQLLNHRYNARLATVITTNQRLEELEPRLRSRLLDPSLVNLFPIIAPDFRAGTNVSQSELSTLSMHFEQTFQSFEADRSDLSAGERTNLKTIVAECQRFASLPLRWIVLAGESGSGKTHLAAAIANQVVSGTYGEVMFVVVPDLLDYLRAAFNPQSSMPYDRRFDEIKNAPLLVLDDLGTESATPWAKEKLFQLLNYRYNAQSPTVITTRHSPEDLEPWLRTRVLDASRCQFLGIVAGGYRRGRNSSPSKPPQRKRHR